MFALKTVTDNLLISFNQVLNDFRNYSFLALLTPSMIKGSEKRLKIKLKCTKEY